MVNLLHTTSEQTPLKTKLVNILTSIGSVVEVERELHSAIIQHWCMCTTLEGVARNMLSTCSKCGGQDAYGKSSERPEDKKKVIVKH